MMRPGIDIVRVLFFGLLGAIALGWLSAAGFLFYQWIKSLQQVSTSDLAVDSSEIAGMLAISLIMGAFFAIVTIILYRKTYRTGSVLKGFEVIQ
jgi:hypothetical protein